MAVYEDGGGDRCALMAQQAAGKCGSHAVADQDAAVGNGGQRAVVGKLRDMDLKAVPEGFRNGRPDGGRSTPSVQENQRRAGRLGHGYRARIALRVA